METFGLLSDLAWIWLDFPDIKHDYIKEVYRFDMCFSGRGPQTGDFHSDCPFHIVSIMAADDLATQGDRASAGICSIDLIHPEYSSCSPKRVDNIELKCIYTPSSALESHITNLILPPCALPPQMAVPAAGLPPPHPITCNNWHYVCHPPLWPGFTPSRRWLDPLLPPYHLPADWPSTCVAEGCGTAESVKKILG